MKPHTYSFRLLSLCALGVFTAQVAQATIVLTDTTNITLANSVISTQTNVINDPDVTGGNVGDLITYTPFDSNTVDWTGSGYTGSRLGGGTAGPGGTNPGNTYAIVGGQTGTVTLDFGGSFSVGSIAIYNGYANRDNGSYTLRDDNGTLGAWTISTSGTTHPGTDLFWLTFDTPVTTSNLFIDYARTDSADNAFAAIQPFNIPEPSTYAALLGLAMGVVVLRVKSRARRG